MTIYTYVGAAVPNFKSVSIRPGANASLTALISIGLGQYQITNIGWNADALAAAWNASVNPLFQQIKAVSDGTNLSLTCTVLGQDFEITCTVDNGSGPTSGVVSARMTLALVATGGTFTLSDGTLTTGAITYSAVHATQITNITNAINALAGYSAGDVTISYNSSLQLYVLDFSLGRFAGLSVPTWTTSGASLTGGTATTIISQLVAGNVGASEQILIAFPAAGSHSSVLSEIQSISTVAIAGTFSITVPGYGTTPSIPYNAGRTVIQQALVDVLGLGNVEVSGGPLLWTDGVYYPVSVKFIGILAGINIPPMTINVLTGGTNETQLLTMTGNPTSGTFTLTFGANTTSNIAYTATAAQIQTALQGLASIGAGNALATGGPLTTVTATPAVNEIQQLTSAAALSPGAFTITTGGHTTASLALTATAPTIQAALVTAGVASGTISVLGGPLVTQNGPFGGADEVESLTLTGMPVSGGLITGTFQVTFGANTTASIDLAASAATVQTALQAIASIGAGNCLVSGGPLLTTSGPIGAAQTEVQTLTVPAGNANTYTLTFNGQTTGALSTVGQPGSAIQSALQGLSSIGSGNILVSPSGVTGPFTLTFAGTLVNLPQNLITVTQAGTPLANVVRTQGGSPGGRNEIQQIKGSSSPGVTITFTFGGQTTSALDANSTTAAQLQTALTGLSSIGAGNVSVGGSTLNGGLVVTFVGSLANSAQALIVSSILGYVTEIQAGQTSAYNYSTAPLTLTFVGSLAKAPQPVVTTSISMTGSSGEAVAAAEVVHGAAQFFTYTNSPLTLTFQNALGGAAQTLVTTGGTNAPTASRITAGAASGNLYTYAPVTVTFAGSKAQTLEALITAATTAGAGTVVVSELVTGGSPAYPVTTLQDGGPQTIQNITGGSWGLTIVDNAHHLTYNVNGIPYNATAATVQAMINAVAGPGSSTVTGGPAPNNPFTVVFSGALGNAPLSESTTLSLTGNFGSSVELSTIRPVLPVPTPSPENIWELTVIPGEGTLAMNSTNNGTTLGYLILTITEPSAGSFAYAINNTVNIPLYGINPDRIQDAINEAFGMDVCRVTRIVHSQEHAFFSANPAGGAVGGQAADLHFWYYKDVFRIVFVNSYQANGTISNITVALPASSSELTWMVSSGIPDYADLGDVYNESQRVYLAFTNYITNVGTTQYSSFTIAQNTNLISNLLTYRAKLITHGLPGVGPTSPGSGGTVKRVGVAKQFQDNQIVFNWVQNTFNDNVEAPNASVIASTPAMNWDATPDQIQKALQDIFGVGNISVTGTLYNSWFTESNIDAPTTEKSYHDLRIVLQGQLANLPFDTLGYSLTATITPTITTDTEQVRSPGLWIEAYSKPMVGGINQRQRFILDNPLSSTTLTMTINKSIVIPGITPSMSVADLQALVNTAIGTLPLHIAPTKWMQPITFYGTTVSAPLEFDFAGAGYQYTSNTVSFGVSNDPSVISISKIVSGSAPVQEVQQLLVTGNPHAGTFTVAASGAIAYNASAATVQTAIGSAPPTVTGGVGQYFFTWPSSSGVVGLLATTASLNNSSSILLGAESGGSGTQTGGPGASITVFDSLQGKGPLYWDCAANFTPTAVPGSQDTVIFDDATSPVNFGLNQTAGIVVAAIGANSKFQYTRNRQVFQNNQKVYLSGTGTAPAGLTFGTAYWIIGQATDYTFQLATSLGGSAITVTTVGSGLFFLAVKGVILQQYSRYSGGQIGLPNINTSAGIPEYLAKYLRLSGVNAQLGIGDGDGLSLLRLDSWNDAATIEIITSGQSSISNIPAILLLSNNSGTTLTLDDGDAGLSVYSNESSLIGVIIAYGGSLVLNNVTATTLKSGANTPVKETNCAIGNVIALG